MVANEQQWIKRWWLNKFTIYSITEHYIAISYFIPLDYHNHSCFWVQDPGQHKAPKDFHSNLVSSRAPNWSGDCFMGRTIKKYEEMPNEINMRKVRKQDSLASYVVTWVYYLTKLSLAFFTLIWRATFKHASNKQCSAIHTLTFHYWV